MLIRERGLKWAMRFYPPLFFQRIWVKSIGKGFRSARVKISRSVLNINYNRSIFGGTIYSAVDCFFPVLYHQSLKVRGCQVKIWVKSAEIRFLKPGYSNLHFDMDIADSELEEIARRLKESGKHVRCDTLEIRDAKNAVCAIVKIDIYFRTFTSPPNN